MMILAATVVLGLSLSAESSKSGQPDSAEASPGDVRPTVDLEGSLVPVDASEISLWLERFRGELLVLDVVAHGSFVNEGDVLIRFDATAIGEQLREAEFDLHHARSKLGRTEQEHRIQEAAAEAELARAEKTAEWAARKLEAYLEKEKAFRHEEIRLRDQSTQHGLEDQRDELEQLEKMYREDELVDATEEIVLKRSRRRLATSSAWAKLGGQRNEHALAHTEAIKREGLEQDAALKIAALDRERRSAQIKQATREAGLERARFDLAKKRENLEGLHRDREMLTVRAPRRGLVLHGEVEAAPGSASLERGSRASLRKTIMVVADPDRLKVVTDVPESLIFEVKSGKAAEVTLVAAPDLQTMAPMKVAYLPTGRRGSKNVYRAEIEMNERDPRLRPGMQCKVSIFVDEPRDAALVSGRADEEDEAEAEAEEEADWEVTQGGQAFAETADEEPADADDDGVSGTWEGTLTGGDLPPGFEFVMTLELHDYGAVTGTITVIMGSGEIEGTFDADTGVIEATITAVTDEGDMTAEMRARISGSSISGTLSVEDQVFELLGSRTGVTS
jgi:multidrug resistance efflux pump